MVFLACTRPWVWSSEKEGKRKQNKTICIKNSFCSFSFLAAKWASAAYMKMKMPFFQDHKISILVLKSIWTFIQHIFVELLFVSGIAHLLHR
jgi:hypothetical protein